MFSIVYQCINRAGLKKRHIFQSIIIDTFIHNAKHSKLFSLSLLIDLLLILPCQLLVGYESDERIAVVGSCICIHLLAFAFWNLY